MGAHGILRCAAYSAATSRPLVAPGRTDDARSHFDDKLLHLRDFMRTDLGRSLAQRRHASMVRFLADLDAETAGRA